MKISGKQCSSTEICSNEYTIKNYCERNVVFPSHVLENAFLLFLYYFCISCCDIIMKKIMN